MKTCTKCGVEKPLSDFTKDRSFKSGLSSRCAQCKRAVSKDWYARGGAKWMLAWGKSNKVSIASAARKRRADDPSPGRSASKRYYQRNTALQAKRYREWREANPHLHRERVRRRDSAQRRAMPTWADPDAIRQIYRAAVKLGKQVDHIVPLVSPLVCGLHVEENLQLMDARDNRAKSNRYWPGMP